MQFSEENSSKNKVAVEEELAQFNPEVSCSSTWGMQATYGRANQQ